MACRPDALANFLLPCDHEEVREWFAHRMLFKTTQEARQKDSATERVFEEEHLEMYTKARLHWPLTEKMIASAGLAGKIEHLPRRSQECVYSGGLRLGAAPPVWWCVSAEAATLG